MNTQRINPNIFLGTILEGCPFELFGYEGHWEKLPDAYAPYILNRRLERYAYRPDVGMVFIHDICHAIDLYANGHVDRLSMNNFGFGSKIDISVITNEINVIAMQSAVERTIYPYAKGRAYSVSLLARAIGSLDVSAYEQDQLLDLMEDKGHWWRRNVDLLRDQYKGMAEYLACFK